MKVFLVFLLFFSSTAMAVGEGSGQAEEAMAEELNKTVESGDVKKLQDLLSAGANPNTATKGFDKYTPLHFAMEVKDSKQRKKMLEILLSAGADPEIKNGNNLTPLDQAAQSGELDELKLLVNKANVNLQGEKGRKLLHIAAREGRLNITKWLIKKQKIDVNVKDQFGWTAVHFATAGKKKDTLFRLIDKYKADVDVRTDEGLSPLHITAANGDRYTSQILARSADTGATDNKGRTILHMSINRFNSPDIIEFFITYYLLDPNARDNEGKTALHYSILEKRPDMAEKLLEHGADPNVKDNQGQTALSLAEEKSPEITKLIKHKVQYDKFIDAVKNQDTQKLQALLEAGVEANSASSFLEYTALHEAMESIKDSKKRKEWLTILMDFGADPEITNKWGLTPIDQAAHFGYLDELKLLVSRGNVNLQGKRGIRVLIEAIKGEQPDTIEWLIEEQGVDVNARENILGQAPIHFAVKRGRIDILKLLLEKYKADVNLKSLGGFTALHLSAVIPENPDIARTLLKHGANIEIQDTEGQTALDWAESNKDIEIWVGPEETAEQAIENNMEIINNIAELLKLLREHLDSSSRDKIKRTCREAFG